MHAICLVFLLMHIYVNLSNQQEKLFSSKNRMEAALGKKLKFDFLPEIEKIHKVSGSSHIHLFVFIWLLYV